jgi:hypothetical protein
VNDKSRRKKIRNYFKRTKPPGILMRLFGIGTNPSDNDIDGYFDMDLKNIVKKSYSELNIMKEEQVRKPIRLMSPILWEEVFGIDSKDLKWRIGKDGIVRFAINRITVIHLTKTGIMSFGCDFNFLKNVALNECCEEFFYQDITSISCKETASSYTLPDKTKLVSAQAFRITVPGDAIEFVITASKLKEFTGGEIPTGVFEKARSVLREMVRERKALVVN